MNHPFMVRCYFTVDESGEERHGASFDTEHDARNWARIQMERGFRAVVFDRLVAIGEYE